MYTLFLNPGLFENLEEIKPSHILWRRNLEMDTPSIIHTSDGKGLLMTTSVFVLAFGKDF